MILITAKKHFDEDIQRARNVRLHAQDVLDSMIRDDLFRSAWMLAVGACDAYFCDAYADLVARTLRAKDMEPGIKLPERLGNLQVPVTAVIRKPRAMRWRMAARGLIERENVLSVTQIKSLFNHFFDPTRKIMNEATIEPWILHASSKQRLWGISKTQYRALPTPQQQRTSRRNAVEQFEERMTRIFKRRHDCIHNCDRPKVAVQHIGEAMVLKAIDDIEFLVYRCHDAFVAEFPEYLRRCGFSAATRNAVT